MIVFYLKKAFLLSFIFFFFVSFNEADAQKRSPVVQTPQDCMTALNSYLVLGDDKTEDDNNSEIPSLSIKGDCEEYKTNATACCSNPNNCAGLAMDIAKTSAPTLPGLFVAYKQYRTSEKAASGELSHEGAQAKVCDVNNKAAIGNFAGQLFSQMSTMFEATCKDKIEQCQNDCNGQIETFRETFKTCFSDFPSDGTVEGLINVAKLCADVKDLKNVPNTLAEAIKKFNPCFINTINNDVVKSCEFGHHGVSEDQNCEHIEDKTIGHILLFAKAYKNSSALEKFPFNKMEELSENSDGKKIVNCSHQPDRVVTQRKHPGAPVSPPFIQMCHAVTDSFRNGPPTPVVPGNPTNPVDMTGNLAGQLPETGRNPPDWMLPGEEDGLIDDGLPDPDNSPDTVKTSDSPNGSSPGSPVSSVAGGSPSGGLGGPSSKDKSGSAYPYPRSGNSYDSFAGGSGAYNNKAAGRGNYPGPYRQAASGEKDMEEKKPFPEWKEKENMDPSKADSIFQAASQRIQLFCSDHSCIE